MATKNSLKQPIRTIAEWKSSLFPDFHDEEQDTNKTPTDIAIKWATRAINSLPNKPIKPTQ